MVFESGCTINSCFPRQTAVLRSDGHLGISMLNSWSNCTICDSMTSIDEELPCSVTELICVTCSCLASMMIVPMELTRHVLPLLTLVLKVMRLIY